MIAIVEAWSNCITKHLVVPQRADRAFEVAEGPENQDGKQLRANLSLPAPEFCQDQRHAISSYRVPLTGVCHSAVDVAGATGRAEIVTSVPAAGWSESTIKRDQQTW
jgi:hypothetical protein